MDRLHRHRHSTIFVVCIAVWVFIFTFIYRIGFNSVSVAVKVWFLHIAFYEWSVYKVDIMSSLNQILKYIHLIIFWYIWCHWEHWTKLRLRKVEDEEHTSRVYCLSDKTHFGLLILHHCFSDSGAQSKCKLVQTTRRKSLRVTKAN